MHFFLLTLLHPSSFICFLITAFLAISFFSSLLSSPPSVYYRTGKILFSKIVSKKLISRCTAGKLPTDCFKINVM